MFSRHPTFKLDSLLAPGCRLNIYSFELKHSEQTHSFYRFHCAFTFDLCPFFQDGYVAFREKVCVPEFGFRNGSSYSEARSTLTVLKRLQRYSIHVDQHAIRTDRYLARYTFHGSVPKIFVCSIFIA